MYLLHRAVHTTERVSSCSSTYMEWETPLGLLYCNTRLRVGLNHILGQKLDCFETISPSALILFVGMIEPSIQ
jgi:hypothetical protein